MADDIGRAGERLSFDQVADALTPQLAPGVSRADLFAALKASRIAPAGTTCAACQQHGVLTAHSPAGEEHATWMAKWAADPGWVPPGTVRHGPRMAMRWCQRCGRPEPENAGCPDASLAEASEAMLPSLPSDPFPDTDVLAGMGVAQMLDAMEAGGVPPLRAERIVGAMLAAHGIMAKEAEGDEDR